MRFLLDGDDALGTSVEDLKVVARCGCGDCPTVLFGLSFEDAPLTGPFRIIADYSGLADNGTLVGIGLYEREGRIAELEAWTVDGGPVSSWPPIDTLSRMSSKVV